MSVANLGRSLLPFIAVIAAAAASGSCGSSSSGDAGSASNAAATDSAPAQSPASAPPPTSQPTSTPVPSRHVQGTAVTLGAGSFSGGTDVAVGLYDVSPGSGQSGNFIVNGTDSYDEILGGDLGVTKVRAKISSGDSIQISSLSQVQFTPVTSAFVTAHSQVGLYAGTWTTGQDLGPGRYVATPGANESGNFIIDAEGVDEILGGSLGVPNVTFNVRTGDVISISGLSQVTLSPA